MAGGLMGKKQPAADDEDQSDLQVQADDDSPDGQPAEPEDTSPQGDGQATYDLFVKNGMRVLFDKNALPAILKSVAAGGDPVIGLARTLASLLVRIVASAEQSGQQIPLDIIQEGAKELLGHLADLAGEAGVHKFTPQELTKALPLTYLFYARMKQQGPQGPQPPAQGAQQQPPPDQGDDQQQPPQGQQSGLLAAA